MNFKNFLTKNYNRLCVGLTMFLYSGAFAQSQTGQSMSGFDASASKCDATTATWAKTLCEKANEIVTALRYLCYPVAVATGIWIVLSMWMGSKRLQDMIPWIIAACLLVILPDFAALIIPS